MNALQVLTKAKELLSDPNKWHKGHFACDIDGDPTAAQDWRACKWCASGALQIVSDGSVLVNTYLKNVAIRRGYSGVPAFNDAPETSHSDLMDLFSEAITDALNEVER